jgi:alkylhydroperoxidase family enzyme
VLTDELTVKVLADYETAPIDEKLRAVLGLARKMTLDHASLSVEDMRSVLALGVTREAIAEALHVAYLFNVYDRLADALGWEVPPAGSGFYRTSAKRLLQRGYL